MSTLETHYRMSLKNALRIPRDSPDPFVYLISGSLPLEALVHIRQFSLVLQLNRLGPEHSSFKHAVFVLQSLPLPKWSWWSKLSHTASMYNLPPLLHFLYSTNTKLQLKNIVKKSISEYWWEKIKSQCSNYSSLVFFDPNISKTCTPHPIVSLSGSYNYLNFKAPLALSMLCGRYRTNKLRHKFNSNISPMCKMCNMKSIEDLPHLLLYCPYLDGARNYAILLWSNNNDRRVYNLFSSALNTWSCENIMRLLLDPSSQISQTSLNAHNPDLLQKCISFSQDFIFSIDRQRNIFQGSKPGNPCM